MKRRPWILIILALVHIVAPFFNLIFDAIWADMDFEHYLTLFFQPQNFSRHWFHFFAPMVAGVMIYLCRRWSYLIYVSIMSALVFVSYASFISRTDLHSPLPLVLAYVFNFGIVTYFLFPAVRSVYFDPRLRWWETMPRYQTQMNAQFTVGATKFPGVVTNFSQTGLFLKSEELPPDHAVTRIEFQFEELSGQLQGQVIHHSKLMTQGFGVRFLHTAQSRKLAKALAEKLQLQGAILPGRNTTDEDTFKWWFRQLMKTGQGLMPTPISKSKPKN